MNNVILDLIPKSSGASTDASASGAGTKAGAGIGAELFRTTLADRLHTASTSAKTAKTTLVPADTVTLKALQTKIAKMLESGASQADVVSALAAQLASSVSQSVETPTADARAKLQTLFETTLAPPGRGDPATTPVTDRALALAQRFSRLANLASAIAGQSSGQQKRIPGNVLDAQRAKDIPAPATTSDATAAARKAPASARNLPTNADADLAAQAVSAETDVTSLGTPPEALGDGSGLRAISVKADGKPPTVVPSSTPVTRSPHGSGWSVPSQIASALKSSTVPAPTQAADSSASDRPATSDTARLPLPAIPTAIGNDDAHGQENIATTRLPNATSLANGTDTVKVGQDVGSESSTSVPTVPLNRSVQIPEAIPEIRAAATAKSSDDVGPVAVSSLETPDKPTSDSSVSVLRSLSALHSISAVGRNDDGNGSRQTPGSTISAAATTTSAPAVPVTNRVQVAGAVRERRLAAPAESPGLAPGGVRSSAAPEWASSEIFGSPLPATPQTITNDDGNRRNETSVSKTAATTSDTAVPNSAAYQPSSSNLVADVIVGLPSRPARVSSANANAVGRQLKHGSKPAATTSGTAVPNPAAYQPSSSNLVSDVVVGLPSRPARVSGANADTDGRKLKLGSKTATSSAASAPHIGSARIAGGIAESAMPEEASATAASWPDGAPVAVETRSLPGSSALGIALPEISAASTEGSVDARTVELGSKTAVAGGGDTTLGRILTRAALAADAREAVVVSSPNDSSDATPTPPSTVAAKSNAAPSDAISLFVKQFETALNSGTSAETPQVTQDDGPLAASLLRKSGHAAVDATAVTPSVAPFTIERVDSSAASAAATPAPPIDHSAIADQVLRGAFMRNVGQSSEMRLTLAPSSLGDVTVKLVVNAGNVTAHIVAETPEVRDALVAAQPQLTKSLADAGLKLTGFSVDLSGNGAGYAQQQSNQPQDGNRTRSSVNSIETDDVDEPLLEAIPTYGPPSVRRLTAGGYNYLA